MRAPFCRLVLGCGLAIASLPALADDNAASPAASGAVASPAASGSAAPPAASGMAAPPAGSAAPAATSGTAAAAAASGAPAPAAGSDTAPRTVVVVLVPTPPPARPGNWKASAELGYIETSVAGATTDSLHAKLHGEYWRSDWRHEANLQALTTSTNVPGTAPTEQYMAGTKSKRSFTPLNYMFIQSEWDKVIPGPLDYQAFISVGYGRYLVKSSTQQLSAEIGGGVRHDQANATTPPGVVPVPTRNSGIGNFNADYRWDISPTVSFGEKVDVQYGVDSTVAHSVTELKKAVTQALAFSINYDYRRTTAPDVPALVNRITTLNLIYQIL